MAWSYEWMPRRWCGGDGNDKDGDDGSDLLWQRQQQK